MQKNKIFHILSYIWVLFIISLFIPEKDNKAVRFHCGQGMILTIFSILCGAVETVLGFAIGWIPFIGIVVCWLVGAVLGIASIVLMVIGIINAVNDKEEELPFIGKYAFYR